MTHSQMRLVVAFMSGLVAALVEPVKFTWRHLLTWLQGLITAAAFKLELHKKQATFAVEAAQRCVPLVPTVRDIPGPVSLPFFGTKWIFSSRFGKYTLGKLPEAYSDMFKTYGPIIKEESLWNFPVISVCGAEDIEKVIKAPTKYPMRPPNEVQVYYRSTHPDKYLSLGVVLEQGEKWNQMRHSLTHDLTNTKVIQSFIPGSNDIADDFVACILRQRDANVDQAVDVVPINKNTGVEATFLMTLGERMGMLDEEVNAEGKAMADAADEVFIASNEAFYGLPFWKFVSTSTYRRFAKAEDTVYELTSKFVDPVIAATHETCQFDDVQSVLLGILRRKELDTRDKKSAIVDFVASGLTAMGNTLSLLLFSIAKHPEKQQKLFKEISMLMETEGSVTTKFLQNAKYLKACIQESFRMVPTAPLVARILDLDLNMSGYHLPAGSVVLVHTGEACMNEKNFVHPDKFIPERWIAQEVEADPSLFVKSPFLVSPFGFQRRICPGRKYTEQFLQIFLAKLVHRFELRCEHDMEMEFKFLLGPASQFHIQFKDRL